MEEVRQCALDARSGDAPISLFFARLFEMQCYYIAALDKDQADNNVAMAQMLLCSATKEE